jgi:hypothetical protein
LGGNGLPQAGYGVGAPSPIHVRLDNRTVAVTPVRSLFSGTPAQKL